MSSSPPRLSDFVVLRTLVIGPTVVEFNRVKTTYTAIRLDGSCQSSELIYSFDERVFCPSQASDVNLACMMTAQVALNYGLFCQEIRFDGLFDARDQRLLMDAMENTSREIYLNKLLEENVFLLSSFRGLEFEKQARYTAAQIRFTNSRFENLERVADIQCETDPERVLVLSSGGKDSLLTYGLLREMNREAHPVFVNESGRHWYTALNAYRYLAQVQPLTARVWCNSDRVFAWMLRQLPFIRSDFGHIRADTYPIRLWTVAVFIFGVLPLARKRNLSRILVGNEYDTTQRTRTYGMINYHSLYDQSIYFDRMLTQYYQRKNWNAVQCSVLRSLSELLIMKILSNRYPELQTHQISCHAAHDEGGRIFPCGKCEKCRRICGMLVALGNDPQHCGYRPQQVEYLLQQLGEQSPKQLGTDVSHLYWLLSRQACVGATALTTRLAKPHPQIMGLRFDHRSTVDDIPSDLRKDLLRILLCEADGARQWRDREWRSFDPLTKIPACRVS